MRFHTHPTLTPTFAPTPTLTPTHAVLTCLYRLSLSPLQLGSGTVLLVDETSVGEGTLTPTGTRSMCALRSIASHQQLPMSYPYYELKVPTDLPLLLLTCSSSGNSLSGASGALKVVLQPPQPVQSTSCPMEESKDSGIGAMQVADMPSTEGSLEPHDRDSEKGLEWLGKARNWWSTVRLIEVSMSESVATEGVDSFAHARQSDCRLTQADFHRWLTVSRLLALSEGASEISSQHWSKMRDLERRRLDRISPCSA